LSHPNKVKGTSFERELVKLAQVAGFKAKRAWGSNGEALGFAKEVDVVIDEFWKVQCKRHKKLPLWLDFTGDVQFVVFREDRGETFGLVPIQLLFMLLEAHRCLAEMTKQKLITTAV